MTTIKPRPPPKPSHLSTWRSSNAHTSPTPSQLGSEYGDYEEERNAYLDGTLSIDGDDSATLQPQQQPALAASASSSSQRTPLKNIWANRESYAVVTRTQDKPTAAATTSTQQQASLSAASSHSKYASALSELNDDDADPWAAADAAGTLKTTGKLDVAAWLRAGGAESHIGRPPSLISTPSGGEGTLRFRSNGSPASTVKRTRLSTLLLERQRASMLAVASASVQPMRQHEHEEAAATSPPATIKPKTAQLQVSIPLEEEKETQQQQPASEGVEVQGKQEEVKDEAEDVKPVDAEKRQSSVEQRATPDAAKPSTEEPTEAAAAKAEMPEDASVSVAEPEDGDATLQASGPAEPAPATVTPVIITPAASTSAPGPTPSRMQGKPARALYDFAGEATFNELSLKAGECFEVLAAELRGGWSLGLLRSRDEQGNVVERRGLVPVGWYCVSVDKSERLSKTACMLTAYSQYIQDFATSPAVAAATQSVSAAPVSPMQLPVELPGCISPSASEQALPSSVFTLAPSASNGSMLSVTSSPPASNFRPVDEDPRARPASGAGQFTKGPADVLQILGAIHDTQATAGPSGTIKKAKIDAPLEGAEPEAPSSSSQQAAAPATPAAAAWRGPGGLLGGRTFNRFSPFVASGAESFILDPPSTQDNSFDAAARRKLYRSRSDSVEADGPPTSSAVNYIVNTAQGPAWKARAAPFHIVVHSPEARWDSRGAEYTAYAVTSLFGGAGIVALETDSDGAPVWAPYDSELPPATPHESLSVWRRFSHFHWLGLYLARAFPALALSLPPTPPKTRAGRARLAAEFVEERRRTLSAWLARVIRHPAARTAEGVLFFLGCAEEHDWNARAPRILADASTQPGLFARTFHAQFGFEADEAEEVAARLDMFNAAFERGMSDGADGVLGAFGSKREAAAQSGSAYRNLSHAMLRLTTGHGLGRSKVRISSAPDEDQDHFYGPAMGALGARGASGATNEEGAWCWRADCKECLAATRALQSTAQALDDVADAYDDHARGALLLQHERLRTLSRPHAQHSALMDVHRTTLARYREAAGEDADPDANGGAGLDPAPEATALTARCETVLNITMAEMNRVHEERVEDWVSAGRNLLDDQIALYSEILQTLQEARAAYNPEVLGSLAMRGPILPGVQSAPLRKPPQKPSALPQPTAPVLAPGVLSSALRPVSLAGEVLGSFFASSSSSPGAAASDTISAPHMSQRSISAGSGGSRFGFWR